MGSGAKTTIHSGGGDVLGHRPQKGIEGEVQGNLGQNLGKAAAGEGINEKSRTENFNLQLMHGTWSRNIDGLKSLGGDSRYG